MYLHVHLLVDFFQGQCFIYAFIQLAQTVVDAGAIAHLAQMILNPDSKLKVSVIFSLSMLFKKH